MENKPIYNCVSGEPYFASQILFELHRNQTNPESFPFFYVRILFNG